MKVIFQELIKGNLPKKEEKEFSVVKAEKSFFIYRNGNPSKDQIMKFNFSEARDEACETRCKKIFKLLGYRFNEETGKWNK